MAEHPITDKLREAVLDDSQSFNSLAAETGISRPTLVRFAKGDGTLRLDHAETLCRYYQLELVKRKG
ncbi:helix-turn-helix transcriptional regulator [Botrimarina sp.]|uniref:helix-turn-helix domain-containing protein n=1 Tax=Botrimarina sp. TaxID=2795802 RepID=UPI0032EB038A